jgi:hypothetical protein
VVREVAVFALQNQRRVQQRNAWPARSVSLSVRPANPRAEFSQRENFHRYALPTQSMTLVRIAFAPNKTAA